MKTYTKKQFEKIVREIIEELNDNELEYVRKGIYTLYNKLELKTDTLDVYKLNDLSRFIITITAIAAFETDKRIDKEMPY